MWVAKANRKLLLDLISLKDPFRILDIESKKSLKLNVNLLGSSELLLIWEQKPKKESLLPDMIWVACGKISDFLAWTATYLPLFKPFTSFCRVLDCTEVDELLAMKEEASFKRIKSAAIGVILAESVTHYKNQDILRVTPISIASTYSFIMARACAFGLVLNDKRIIRKRWGNARNLTKQPKRVLDIEEIDSVWTVLGFLEKGFVTQKTGLSHYDNLITIYKSCCGLLKNDTIDTKRWVWSEKLPLLKETNDQMKASVEKRVIWFEKCVNEIASSSTINRTVAAFICGYLASQIAPGSMKYVDLLYPYVKTFPSVLVWYGLCAGLYKNNDVCNYDGGLGWRVLRDMLQWESVYKRPQGDIALEELEILLNADKPDKSFRAASHTHLVVEILPRIYTVVVWPRLSNGIKLDSTENREEEKGKLVNEILMQLSQIFSQVNFLAGKVKTLQKDSAIEKETKKAASTKERSSYRKNESLSVNSHPELDLKYPNKK